MKTVSSIIKRQYQKTGLCILSVGIGAGILSYLFHVILESLTHLAGTAKAFGLKAYFWSAGLALGSYFLSKLFFPDTGGSGIPQVKLALVAFKGKMPRRMPFGKFFTSLLTLSSGLSFGKEGPMVTLSAAWGHLMAHLFRLDHQLKKVMVTSGATAGLAAAFHTPLAAVVFTVEEIIGELNTRYLAPIILSSVIASVTAFKLLGNQTTFSALNYKIHTDWHLFLYLGLGVAMSLLGATFTKFILIFKKMKKTYFKKLDFLFILLAIILIGLSSSYTPKLLGDGISTINQLLQGKNIDTISFILVLLIFKLILTSLSYSTGLSGGLFMPVLFLGALGGSLFGLILQTWGISHIEVGVFALLGMTSLLVAVIRAPFTAFVMLFEMTRDYELILPLMISSITAYWISELISSESVYESVAEYEGVHLPTPRDNHCLNEMAVEVCMKKNVITLDPNLSAKEALDKIQDFDYGGFPLVINGRLTGMANSSEIKINAQNNPEILLKDFSRTSVITIYPDQSLLVALDKMKRFEIGRIPVVSRFNDKLVLGILTPEDIITYIGTSKN